MMNSILVKYDDQVLTVLLVPKSDHRTVNEILDIYAKWGDWERSLLTGHRIRTVDITSESDRTPFAAGDWPS